jgi:hypothetical protein
MVDGGGNTICVAGACPSDGGATLEVRTAAIPIKPATPIVAARPDLRFDGLRDGGR